MTQYGIMLRNYSKRQLWEGASIHGSFCNKGQEVQNKTKENQMSQIDKINAFPLRVNCQSLDSWNHPFDVHLSYLGPSILCFLIHSLLKVYIWWYLPAVDCLMAGILISSWVPWAPAAVASVWWLNGCCNTLCPPIWQAAFLVHKNDFEKLVKYQQTSRQ